MSWSGLQNYDWCALPRGKQQVCRGKKSGQPNSSQLPTSHGTASWLAHGQLSISVKPSTWLKYLSYRYMWTIPIFFFPPDFLGLAKLEWIFLGRKSSSLDSWWENGWLSVEGAGLVPESSCLPSAVCSSCVIAQDSSTCYAAKILFKKISEGRSFAVLAGLIGLLCKQITAKKCKVNNGNVVELWD